ncbi:lactococcin 972 family bacteriocin [Streptomyces sp. NPDC001739]
MTNSLGRSIAVGFAAVALAVGGSATSAAANDSRAATVTANGAIVAADGAQIGQITIHKRGDGTQPPAELGNPSEWGVIEVPASAARTLGSTCLDHVSGGKWCYGTELVTSGKRCFSNYLHNSKTHASAVKMAGVWDKSGPTSKTKVARSWYTAGAGYTCNTYYSVD